MTAPQPGDTVRVVIEGDVTQDWTTIEELIQANGGNIVSTEVLPKPLALGDVLSAQADYDRAPIGTVALDELSGVLSFKRSSNSWADSTDGFWYGWELHGSRTVVFLPHAA